MAEQDEKQTLADEKSTDPAPNDGRKRSNSGCLILFVLGLPLLDAFGVALGSAGQYCQVALVLGLAAFAIGAASGAYVSVRRKEPWWSSCRWAIWGILAMCMPAIIFVALLR